jgi:single-strand DNA-binding protein
VVKKKPLFFGCHSTRYWYHVVTGVHLKGIPVTEADTVASYNRVILMGNLTRDVELRYTPGGTAVTDVTLAVNDRRRNQTGEWVEETTFVDVTLWGRTAEVASEYLSKGSPLFVEGRLKLDQWEQEGQKRSRLRVVCDRMQLVGGRQGGDGRPSPEGRSVSSHSGVEAASVGASAAPASGSSHREDDYDDGPTPF